MEYFSSHPNVVYMLLSATQIIATVVMAGALVSIAISLKKKGK